MGAIPAILASEPFAYWPLDDDVAAVPADTTAREVIGNRIGTLYLPGGLGNIEASLEFRSPDPWGGTRAVRFRPSVNAQLRVENADLPVNTLEWTYEARVLREEHEVVGGGTAALLRFVAQDTSGFSVRTGLSAGSRATTFWFGSNDGIQGDGLGSFNWPSIDVFYHYALVVTPTLVTTYLDAVSVHTRANPPASQVAARLEIGGRGSGQGNNYKWPGSQAHVAFFSRALDLSEIVAHRDAVPPPEIDTVSPGSGSTSGGVEVTLAGAYLQFVTAVTVVGNGWSAPATIVAQSNDRLTVLIPPGQMGVATFRFTFPGGQADAGRFTYGLAPPRARPIIILSVPPLPAEPEGPAPE